MQLLDQAIATQFSMQDEISKAKLTGPRVLEESKKRESELWAELVKAKAETKLALNQKNEMVSRLNALVDSTYKWEECRNCGDDFGSWIERLGSQDDPKFQLRCSNCRCRHAL